ALGLQQVCSCDLLFNGNIHGISGEGYNGWDFIFRLGSSLVVADGAAWMTWQCGSHHCPIPIRISWMDFSIIPFPELPDIHVYRTVKHGTLVLSCHMYRFCPRISWMKGEEIQDQETEWGGIIPNSDDTFHTWARTEVLPGEWKQHRCQVENPKMLELGIFIWGKAGNSGSVNWEFGNEEFGNTKQQGRGSPSPSHHLALPRAGISSH
ncbi:major histocompatibility complex class I-related gene protein-like, partial [Parus major]|uniref:major histocompatibility complex class I-related gene protein-like n=1 Tax=Parus major TaxID=9157 RepID=UPI0014439556